LTPAPAPHYLEAPVSEEAMAWKKPKIVEIAVGTEINAYACATR
jgi:coenzyme PQQ precursor peptide PqqA